MLRRLVAPLISVSKKSKLTKFNDTFSRHCVTSKGDGNLASSLLHRAAFVGVSVGIATPALIPVGIATVWLRMLPVQNSFIRLGVVGIVGGGLMPVLYHYVLPFLREYSDVIMPFALANGISASILYGFSELLYGLNLFKHQILGISSVGPLVGIGTAILAPFLWPVLCKVCWNNDLQSIMLNGSSVFHFMDLYYEFLLVPVALPLGFFSGIALGNILTPIMLGATQSMNIATAATSAVAFIYFYIYRAGSEDYYYEVRRDPVTLQRSSYNLLTKINKNDDGQIGHLSSSRRSTVFIISKITELPRIFLNLYKADEVSDNDAATTTMNYMLIRDRIVPLIDIILRAKYKMMNNIGTSESSDIFDQYQDVDKMVNYVEVAIALKRRGDANSGEDIDKVKANIVKECIKSGVSRSYTDHLRAEGEVKNLFEHLDVMDAELKSRLNYEIDMSILDKHTKQKQYNQVYTMGAVTASIAVAIVTLINIVN